MLALLVLQGQKDVDYIIREESSGKVVGRVGYLAKRKAKGLNQLVVFLDPAFPEIARPVICQMLREIIAISPKLRIESAIPRWMPAALEAAESYGFKRRTEYIRMGRTL